MTHVPNSILIPRVNADKKIFSRCSFLHIFNLQSICSTPQYSLQLITGEYKRKAPNRYRSHPHKYPIRLPSCQKHQHRAHRPRESNKAASNVVDSLLFRPFVPVSNYFARARTLRAVSRFQVCLRVALYHQNSSPTPIVEFSAFWNTFRRSFWNTFKRSISCFYLLNFQRFPQWKSHSTPGDFEARSLQSQPPNSPVISSDRIKTSFVFPNITISHSRT